jgi:hypothetical protein
MSISRPCTRCGQRHVSHHPCFMVPFVALMSATPHQRCAADLAENTAILLYRRHRASMDS